MNNTWAKDRDPYVEAAMGKYFVVLLRSVVFFSLFIQHLFKLAVNR
jgi:hypothetical protein